MSKPPVVLSFPPSIAHHVFAASICPPRDWRSPRPVQHHFVVTDCGIFVLFGSEKLDSDNTKEPVEQRLPTIHLRLSTMNSPQFSFGFCV